MTCTKIFKPIVSLVMTLAMLIGIAPIVFYAQVNPADETTEPPIGYIYVDGERIYLDDARVENHIILPTTQLQASGITPFNAGNVPNISGVTSLSLNLAADPVVYMSGSRVSARRYQVSLDGITYEAFCADPNIRGPETAGAVYEMAGEANPQLLNSLRNGFPVNTAWSSESDMEDRLWWTYITRVAVAIANNPTRTFTGDPVALAQAESLANGQIVADHNAFPPIMLNGNRNAQDTGRDIQTSMAQSETFAVTHNRKTNLQYNPFRFEWAAGTPTGSRLVVDGVVVAIAPMNPTRVFRNDITSFRIDVPNTAANRGQTAALNLVGIHNHYADRIWLMQNATNPDTWQDIVFYIPEVSASAAFSFTSTTEPPPYTPPVLPPSDPTSVTIQKIDALSRENIPGALMRLRGMSSMTLVTQDGQTFTINNTGINLSQVLTAGATTAAPGEIVSTVSNGVWNIEGLPYGFYMVEEERAPENYSLLPGHTAFGFWVVPPTITINAEGIPVINTETETVITEDSFSFIHVETVDHVDVEFEIVLTPNEQSILITFENYPFGQIEVSKFCEVTGVLLAGAHFRIQGYFAEGTTNGMPIDRVGVTGGDGRVIFDNLPAGQYTISEIQAPPGFELDSTAFRSVSLTWGQTASTSFFNRPMTFVEVVKIDGDTGAMLDGAVFRLTDPTTGETWEGTTSGGRVRLGSGGGSSGNQLVAGRLYILTEIQAPAGYVLDPTPRQVIASANNQLNIVTVSNYRLPTLTIRKFNELTGEPLAGATFRIWRTEGETWSELQITDANGVIVLTGLDPGIYSVQEIDAPFGFFIDPERKEILLSGGDNKELTFFNRPHPILTIFKRDQVTGEPIEGVRFRVHRLEGGTVGEFLTDENGMIVLSPATGFLLTESVYRVTELQPPAQYLLGDNHIRDAMLKWYEPTELIFENLLKPTLIFEKTNGLTGRGISGATFRVQFEAPNGGIVYIGTFVTRCGLIVIPHVQPGWYVITEIRPAPGFQLPSNPVTRLFLSPGQNSYTFAQTNVNLFVDPRTNPNTGSRGNCGDWCGYLCFRLCAGNCGNPGGGNNAGGTGGAFGNMVITNGNGQPLGTVNAPPTNPTEAPTLTVGTVTRNSNQTATITFSSSAAGRYFTSIVAAGASAPNIATGGIGTAAVAGVNTITVHMTAGARDVYIRVRDASGNLSNLLKVSVPVFEETSTNPPQEPDDPPADSGRVIFIHPDFSGITITFGNQ